jgi:hypothetical protein
MISLIMEAVEAVAVSTAVVAETAAAMSTA